MTKNKNHSLGSDASSQTEEVLHTPLFNNAHYVKDLSFENPGILDFLTNNNQKPDISINLQVGAHKLDKNVFEVTLFVEAKATLEKNPAFVLELTYAGIFTVAEGLSDDDSKPLLLIEAPHLLFPFARSLVSKITQEGGLPPLLLNQMNFEALYKNQHQQTKFQGHS